MPLLNDEEKLKFLNQKGVLMRIACVRSDRSPLVTPVWFIFKESAIYFTPRAESEWFGCLKADARVALCIDEENLPYRKIIVEDRASMVYDLGEDDLWRDLYTEMAERYIEPDFARAYVEDTIDQERALFSVSMSSRNTKGWRMPFKGEDETGIWHHRYYAKGTKFSKKSIP